MFMPVKFFSKQKLNYQNYPDFINFCCLRKSQNNSARISRFIFSASILILSLFLSSCGEKSVQTADYGERIAVGWLEFRMGEYKRAIDLFSSVVSSSAEKGSKAAALYGLASCHWQKLPDADKAQAESIFKRIIEEYPETEYAAWSKLALVRMEHIVPAGQEPNYPSLREKYRAVFEKYKDSAPGHEAFVYMLSTYVVLLDCEKELMSGLELADKFIAEHPDSPYISSVWSLRAEICEALAMPDEMLSSMINALETKEMDPTNPWMEKSWAYWAIATAANFDVGDFITARKYYQLLIDEYPQDRRIFAAILAIERIDALLKQFEEEKAE